MKRYKTLYDKLKTEYKQLLIDDIKKVDEPTQFMVMLAKKSLKSKEFFIELTIQDLDRLAILLELNITNENIYRLFNTDKNLKL